MLAPAWSCLVRFAAAALAQADAAAAATTESPPPTMADLGRHLDRWLLPGAMFLAAVGLWLLLSQRGRRGRLAGAAIALGGFVLLGLDRAAVGDWFVSGLYWLMAGVAVLAAGGTIASRSPVYSAVCFAVSLLGVAGLFLLSGAQFLSIATVAVYAGAIVVMFLFVVMLAQPEGHAYYDRVSWGQFPPLAAAVAGALLIGGVGYVAGQLDGFPPTLAPGANPVLAENHMAHLGRELFSVQLISVEIAATLLLIALVGSLAMVIHGRDPVLRRWRAASARPAEETPPRPGARRLQPVGDNGRE